MSPPINLAERVEAAEGPSLVLDRDIALAIYPDARPTNVDARISVWDGNGRTQITVKPYTASLDAAMQLVPEDWNVTLRGVNDSWHVALNATNFGPLRQAFGFARKPALALCAAALRAKAGEG